MNYGVYLLPKGVDGDPHIDLVVKNAEAAKSIHFQTFLRDCHALQRPNEELANLVSKAKQKADHFLREQYDDVMANFDPKIKKFQKRRKLIVAPDAQDELGSVANIYATRPERSALEVYCKSTVFFRFKRDVLYPLICEVHG